MELYHALNRGVDKRIIFLDDHDRARFVHDLFEFNDSGSTNNVTHSFRNKDLRSPYLKKKERIVDLHGWVLMENHYHLLLSERVEGGISQFLRKLNIGYAKYFNEKYRRSGTLFQGRTKKILIERDSQFNYILHYIHLNPLDYLTGAEDWRIRDKKGIKNTRNALDYLDTYRWSSYLDYAGKKNFPSILTTSLFNEHGSYTKTLSEYLMDAEFDNDTKLNLE